MSKHVYSPLKQQRGRFLQVGVTGTIWKRSDLGQNYNRAERKDIPVWEETCRKVQSFLYGTVVPHVIVFMGVLGNETNTRAGSRLWRPSSRSMNFTLYGIRPLWKNLKISLRCVGWTGGQETGHAEVNWNITKGRTIALKPLGITSGWKKKCLNVQSYILPLIQKDFQM